jgi:hypothetical protein
MFRRPSSKRPTIAVRRPRPSWRHSRNELSEEPGTIQLSITLFACGLTRLGNSGWVVGTWNGYVLSVIAALAPFGIYRLWLSIILVHPEWWYGFRTNPMSNMANAPEWKKYYPDLSELDLEPRMLPGNLLAAVVYLTLAIWATHQ